MNLDGLLFNLNYPEEVERAVRDKIFRDEKQIKQIAQTAYRGDNFDFLLCKRMPLTRLAVVTWLLMEKYLLYQAKGISDEMIFETFRDVALRAGLYYQKTGKPGISRDDVVWFRHIMNAEIFKIGALQYQPFEMLYLDEETIGEPYMVFSEEQKTGLPAGSPVINCHIQRGADLRAAGKSLDMARTFFAEYFPDVHYRAFLVLQLAAIPANGGAAFGKVQYQTLCQVFFCHRSLCRR